MKNYPAILLVGFAGFLLLSMNSGSLAGNDLPGLEVEAGKQTPAKDVAAKKSFEKPPKVGTKAICPVMGTVFTVKKDTPRSEYKGRHYVFCCPGCKPKFDADPEKYADKNN